MSKTAIIAWIIAAVVVIGGLWWWYAASQSSSSTGPSTSSTAPATTASNTPQPNPIIASPNDDSDAAINHDLASVDAQMNGVNSDQTNVSNSIQ